MPGCRLVLDRISTVCLSSGLVVDGVPKRNRSGCPSDVITDTAFAVPCSLNNCDLPSCMIVAVRAVSMQSLDLHQRSMPTFVHIPVAAEARLERAEEDVPSGGVVRDVGFWWLSLKGEAYSH